MKRSEIINTYADAITDEMIRRYRIVIESDGRVQYAIYIWEDGEIEVMEQAQGDHSYLKPYDSEPRALYYVTTVEAAGYSPWDVLNESEPENPEEAAKLREEADTWMVEEYTRNASDLLDTIIDDAKQEEDFDA